MIDKNIFADHDPADENPVVPDGLADTATTDQSSDAPKSRQPRAKRPNHPDRTNNLLKADRSGVGGPATDAGKAASCMNHARHGMYSRGSFRLMPWEKQEEYNALAARLLKQFPPIDEASQQMLDQLTQASWRFFRCDRSEYLAHINDMTDLDKYQRGIFGSSSYRTRCERSYYLHYEKLKKLFAHYKQEQDEIRKQAQAKEREEREEAAKPQPRFNAEGEEMHPDWAQRTIRKFSCIPESPSNEVLEFDRTLAGKYSVKCTPLRDWEGGRLLHPDSKPPGMTGDWPDYLLGPYKDYYKNLKGQENKKPD